MLVDFNSLSDDSRVWIYASEKKLTSAQEKYILQDMSGFLEDWVAHDLPLKAGIDISESHFIVVALDEKFNKVSGCSIDLLQNQIQAIERNLSNSLMNRLNVFCIIDNEIQCMHIHQLDKEIDGHMLFYDFTIKKKGDLAGWLKPIKQGWCKSFLV